MVLVVHACVRSAGSGYHDTLRTNDVETRTGEDQRGAGVSDITLYEKLGYMEVCPRLLREIMVENWVDYVGSILHNTYSDLWQVG